MTVRVLNRNYGAKVMGLKFLEGGSEVTLRLQEWSKDSTKGKVELEWSQGMVDFAPSPYLLQITSYHDQSTSYDLLLKCLFAICP